MEAVDLDLETVYDLGSAKYKLMLSLNSDAPLEDSYQEYKEIAQILKIDIPKEPSEADTDAKKEFIRDQTREVERKLVLRGDNSEHVYAAGENVAHFLLYLYLNKLPEAKDNREWYSGLQLYTMLVQRTAEHLNVDVNEELDTLKSSMDGSTIRYKNKIKEKMCTKSTTKRPKRSEVDPTRKITDEDWVVSLVRLPDRQNDEHAFLVLEGKTGNKSMIWFTDFVVNDMSDILLPGMRDGKVRIHYHAESSKDSSSDKLLFACRKKMMNIEEGDHFLHSTWPIPKPTAEILMKNIEAKKEKPPKYNIAGDSSVFAGSTAAIKSTEIGHNCYTFAKTMLHDLKDPYIRLPQESLKDWVYSATSRVLVDNRMQGSWEAGRFTLVLVLLVGAVVGVVIAQVLQKIV